MPTVELDLRQLAKAAHQLSAEEFRVFLKELSEVSRAEFARERDDKSLRAAIKARLPVRKQRQLGVLLDKGNSGSLTVEEQAILNVLIDEVEQRALESTEAMCELQKRGVDARPKPALARCQRK